MQTTEKRELSINKLQIKKGALVIRAINHSLRQEMLTLMHRNGNINVTELYRLLKLEQSVASQHLAILRRAGLVTTARDGKTIFYSVNYNKLDELNHILDRLVS
ncbi:ArsR/SmtB family transcription factor [Aridibaculum aurantiacum]|uniref:ArsR/SmtB family transcription factor n=1 Tax=Aridibaculum aurantiacum TaxID=2810307 RepID=UPI001A95851A|nr:metalloregulator ArsR/SmtB family transcription factor [Aridibaculum aurantiacum]